MAGPILLRQPVNVHAALKRVLGLARSGFAAEVTFLTEYAPALPVAIGDHARLLQVFLSLVKNAVAALPDHGGRVMIATRYRHDVRVNGGDRMHIPLEVSVRDNGSGIPAAVRPYVFDPFVTVRARGTGLGLAWVAKVVAEHGGSVDLTSDETGTEFRVCLPVVDARRQKGSGRVP